MTREIEITGCTDGLMWYAAHVGKRFPLLRIFDDCYLSREPAGYSNIVWLRDARIVEDETTKPQKNIYCLEQARKNRKEVLRKSPG